MKTRIIITTLTIAALAMAPSAHAETPAASTDQRAAANAASAHAPEEHPEWAELFGGATLSVVWQSAAAAAEKTRTALAQKQLAGVADWAETIHLAAHALMDQVELPEAPRKVRLDAALRQAAALADEVLDAAQHEEHEAAAASFMRLSAALTLTKTRLPQDVTQSRVAPEQLRFATAAGHGHTH